MQATEQPTVAASQSANSLTPEQLDRRIQHQLREWRPLAWEDDISRNTVDTAPFSNLPPISQRVQEVVDWSPRLPQKLTEPVDIAAMAAKDTAPIPAVEDREGYAPGNDALFWTSGLVDYLKMLQVTDRHAVDVQSYFDFGCATGRVIRHFAMQSQVPCIWGSDINARHIRWLCEFMPKQVRPIANHCIPTLPIPDASVDLVSAFSVFTHIDTFETCWLAELSRILRPGGIAYLTIHNEATWEVLRGEIDNPENRLVQSILRTDPTVREKLALPLAEGRTVYRFTDFGPYRAQVFHSNGYIHQVWSRFFEVREILDCHHVRQTVVVLQK